MQKKSLNLRDKSIPFRKLQKLYGLKSPEQIKQRIIWDHIRALIIFSCGDSAKIQLGKINRHFRLCEQMEIAIVETGS